ncbi:MAG TPA: DUF4230 domain-containing protein [candidate division Zixibacteria bacterium]|nr:DUF4230 domain-containing protein [candidate division Zixibacteria bacterium]
MSDRRFNWPMALAVSVAVLAIAALLAFRWTIDIPGRWAGGAAREARETAAATARGLAEVGRSVGAAIEGALMVRPRVLVAEQTVVEPQVGVTKLVLVEQDFAVTRDMRHTFLRSTKRLALRGRFHAGAGFDLEKEFTVVVEEDRIRVRVPAPEVLGVELLDYEAEEDRDGLWNKITPEDRGALTKELLAAARAKAEDLGLPNAAEAELRRRLADVAAAFPGRPLELEIQKAGPPPDDML